MRRDDLPPGYDGWQVLDATSQDKQCGRFRIGPASVLAIRERKFGKQWFYDGDFVISEVTADIRFLRVGKNFTNGTNKHLSVAHVTHDEVGVALVTSPGHQGDPLDLTANYKDMSERPAKTGTILSASHFPPPTKDCAFEVKTSDHSSLGEEITITITIRNKGAMMRTVDGRVVGTVIHYTGHSVRNFMSMQFSGVISPGQSELPYTILWSCMYVNIEAYHSALALVLRLHPAFVHNSGVLIYRVVYTCSLLVAQNEIS